MRARASGGLPALRTGDRQRADAAFAQALLGTCAGCHQSFQLRSR